jgi:alpha-D-xyloside xylohydrolase
MDAWTPAVLRRRAIHAHEVETDPPLARIPLYVRAGSILPMGPEIEYASQNSGGPIELRIYRGADGKFDLYEDSGDSCDYEKGEHTVIPLRWDESAKTLTVDARQGSFPEIIQQRTFRVAVVGNGHGAGPAITASADKEIVYNGSKIQVKLP